MEGSELSANTCVNLALEVTDPSRLVWYKDDQVWVSNKRQNVDGRKEERAGMGVRTWAYQSGCQVALQDLFF